MALTTVSSSYALLQQPHRLIVGNPCIPTASAIASKDLRFGNGGRDKLCGCQSNDTLTGPKGYDYLIAGLGNDILSHGIGRDRFVLTAGSGHDLIADLTKGEDLLVLAGGLTFAQLSITQNANAAFIRINQNNQLLAALNGVPASATALNDFTIFG
jgi:Ca2+-binding RTX toxin-like protein